MGYRKNGTHPDFCSRPVTCGEYSGQTPHDVPELALVFRVNYSTDIDSLITKALAFIVQVAVVKRRAEQDRLEVARQLRLVLARPELSIGCLIRKWTAAGQLVQRSQGDAGSWATVMAQAFHRVRR
jgi:hypothetical protein